MHQAFGLWSLTEFQGFLEPRTSGEALRWPDPGQQLCFMCIRLSRYLRRTRRTGFSL